MSDEMAEMTGGAEDWREVNQALHDGFVAGFEYGLAEIERIERERGEYREARQSLYDGFVKVESQEHDDVEAARGEYREARVMSPFESMALAFEELRDSIREAMGDAERF